MAHGLQVGSWGGRQPLSRELVDLTMLRAVIQRVVLHNLASFRFLISSVLALALALLAAAIAADDLNLRLRNARRQSEEHSRSLEKAQVYSYLQPVVVRMPEPLSMLDQGFDARLGNEVGIHVFEVPAAAAGGYRGNEYLSTLRELDLTTVVRVVLGLLALLLSFDAVVGEKEGGTLKLVFANPMTRGRWLAGLYLGTLLTLLLALALAVGPALATLVLRAEVGLSGEHWLRLAAMLGSYLAYLSAMALAGLALSLLARTSSASLVLGILLWLMVGVVIPGTVSLLGRGGASPRTVQQRTAEILAERDRRLLAEWRRDPLRAARSGHSSPILASSWNRATLRRFGSAAYYDSLARYYAHEVELGRRYAEEIFALTQRQTAGRHRLERLVTLLSLPSPAFLLDRLAESFAGTASDDHDRFLAACRAYRRQLIEYLEAKGAFGSWRWFTDDPPGNLRPWPTLLGLRLEEVTEANLERLFQRIQEPAIAEQIQRDLAAFEKDPARRLPASDLPPFPAPRLSLGQASRRVGVEIAGMLALNLLLAAGVVALARRYDPR